MTGFEVKHIFSVVQGQCVGCCGRSGISALNPKLVPIHDLSKLPKQIANTVRGVVASSSSHLETTMAETLSVIAAETQLVSTLGDLPMIVISHGRLYANAVPPSLGAEVRDAYERVWQELQVEITDLSRHSRRIVAERSGHNVIFDQPEIVIQAILELVGSTTQIELPQKEVASSVRLGG